MLAQDRYKKIIEILERDKSVKTSELIELFDVSVETVRRDLEYLENEGCLKRVYGGAVLEEVKKKMPALDLRRYENVEEKEEIANIAMGYIKEGQSIAMDAGTTTLEIARKIKNKFNKLTVVTNSLLVANELTDASKFTVILCGGIFKSDESSLVGDLALESISKLHIDTAFIGVSGISLKDGLTDYPFDEIQVQKKFIEVSDNIIAVGTSNKFEKSALMQICDLKSVDMIITDSKLSQCIYESYKKSGIKVINK